MQRATVGTPLSVADEDLAYRTARNEHVPASFDAIDTNGDGVIDRQEYEAFQNTTRTALPHTPADPHRVAAQRSVRPQVVQRDANLEQAIFRLKGAVLQGRNMEQEMISDEGRLFHSSSSLIPC